jgi:hypothetical protein
VDRCALFVDAGYVLSDGAMAVHGTRRRESVSWDYAGLVQFFGGLATERTKQPLLRTYWYEATADGQRSADHDTLADLPGVKLRVAKMLPGRREGVEGEIRRDLTTLARNKAVSDAVVVSAEEDLAQVIAYVQEMGMRVTLLPVAVDGDAKVSRALRQECDDIEEISAEHLRPYVELISGAAPPRPDESDEAPALSTAANGNLNGSSYNGNGLASNGNGHASPGRAAAYAQPQAQRPPALSRPAPEYQAGTAAPEFQPSAAAAEFQPAGDVQPADRPDGQVAQPAVIGTAAADPGQPERADTAPAADYPHAAGVDYSTSVDYGTAAEYAPPAEYAAPAEYAPAAEYKAAVDQGPVVDYGSVLDYGPVPDYPAPAPVTAPVSPREDFYAAPVAVPAPAEDLSRDRDRSSAPSRLGADLSAYAPGAVREPYQRDGGLLGSGDTDDRDRLQPVPAALPSGGSAQIRRLPTRGPASGGPNVGPLAGGFPPAPLPGAPALAAVQPAAVQPGLAAPSGPAGAAAGQQFGGQQFGGQQFGGQPANGEAPGGHLVSGQPTAGQPAAPVAPVLPMDANGSGYAGVRSTSYGGPRQVIPGPGASAGLGGPGVAPGAGGQSGPGPVPPGSQPLPAARQQDGSGPLGPIGLVGQGGYPGGAPGASSADAVQSAYEEGQAFGDSVARDAPALWLEAVLARKPRMPSDLEARLLQGSALPIDFLLHDEVRHALRRGFWDALERARR